MTEKSKKKSKKNPIFKTVCWLNTFVTKDYKKWNASVAENILVEYNPSESWKGIFKVFGDYIYIKSKGNSFKMKCNFREICGLFSSQNNKNILILGVLTVEDIMYLSLRFENIRDKDRVIVEISDIKGPDEAEKSKHNAQTYNEINLNPTEELYEGITPIFQNEELEPEMTYYKIIKPLNEIKRFETEELRQSSDSADEEYENEIAWDMDSSNGVMWIEDTKYIEYVPSLGRYVQTDEGSIYMYCAHQIISPSDGVHHFNSGSDSD